MTRARISWVLRVKRRGNLELQTCIRRRCDVCRGSLTTPWQSRSEVSVSVPSATPPPCAFPWSIHLQVQRPPVANASGAGGGSFPECSSSLATSGTTGQEAFHLCLTRSERDAEVLRVLEAFSLNADQASLLWTCARWFRPASPASERHEEGPVEKDDGPSEGAGGSSPVVLVHGVFGETAFWSRAPVTGSCGSEVYAH